MQLSNAIMNGPIIVALRSFPVFYFSMSLIAVKEAALIIEEAIEILPTVEVSLVDSIGRALRQPVRADREVPPYDRVMMDGIAFSYRDWQNGVRQFSIAGTQGAGSPPKTLSGSGNCFEIMTGSVLANGCDCVAPYEEVEINEGKAQIIDGFTPQPGRFIHKTGSDYPSGATLLRPGCRLTSRQVAVTASSGCAHLRVTRLPKISLISTGDELVEIDQLVERHQIRTSNAYSLQAGLAALGISTVNRCHLNDRPEELEKKLASLLEDFDVLILSGGVSKGRYDYVPEILQKLGVKKLFHGVAQRPGKPFWFGVKEGGPPVFALPGNPLSTLVCFHRFVVPALQKMLGLLPPQPLWAALTEPFDFKQPMTFFLPVITESRTNGLLSATPRPVSNSGDYASIVETSGFVELPGGDLNDFPTGYVAKYFGWI